MDTSINNTLAGDTLKGDSLTDDNVTKCHYSGLNNLEKDIYNLIFI
jgi:hypothetical protein